ncbi:hypothetical protein YC2023_083813 [Brassica napus]
MTVEEEESDGEEFIYAEREREATLNATRVSSLGLCRRCDSRPPTIIFFCHGFGGACSVFIFDESSPSSRSRFAFHLPLRSLCCGSTSSVNETWFEALKLGGFGRLIYGKCEARDFHSSSISLCIGQSLADVVLTMLEALQSAKTYRISSLRLLLDSTEPFHSNIL